jgi:hypothetical protein
MDLLRLIVFPMAPGSVTCIMKVLFTDYILPIFEQEKSHQFNLPRLMLHKKVLDRKNSVGSLSLTYQNQIRAGKIIFQSFNKFAGRMQLKEAFIHFISSTSPPGDWTDRVIFPIHPTVHQNFISISIWNMAVLLAGYKIMWLSFILSLWWLLA